MKFQPIKAMDIRRSVLGAVSILSSLGMFASPAWAETRQIDFTISSQSNQTFSALMQQAQFLATSFIEQEFTENSSTTEISVSILGERNGQQAPLLFSRVSRSDWQRQAGIQQWTRYFANSAVLLGFQKPQMQQPASSPARGTSVEQTTSSPARGTSVEQTTSSPSPGTSIRNRANREERDTGFR